MCNNNTASTVHSLFWLIFITIAFIMEWYDSLINILWPHHTNTQPYLLQIALPKQGSSELSFHIARSPICTSIFPRLSNSRSVTNCLYLSPIERKVRMSTCGVSLRQGSAAHCLCHNTNKVKPYKTLNTVVSDNVGRSDLATPWRGPQTAEGNNLGMCSLAALCPFAHFLPIWPH